MWEQEVLIEMMRKHDTKLCRKGFLGANTRQRVVAVVLLSLLAASAAHGQFDIILEPQVTEVQLGPGKRAVLPFRLTNVDKDNPALVRVHASDIRQGTRGQYLLVDSLMPYSCVPWLTLPDTLFEIGPGEMLQIPVQVKVPYDAQGGAYGAIVFEIIQKKPAAADPTKLVLGAQYRFQLPAWIEMTVTRGRPIRGRLTPGNIIVTPTADNPKLLKEYGDRGMVVSAEVENTGDIHVFTEGRVIIRDENQRLVRDTRLGSGRGAILPGARTNLRTIMKLPRPGKYSVKAIVEYGGRSPAIAQTTFEVTDIRSARVGESEIALPLYIDVRPDEFELSIPGGGFRVLGLTLRNREVGPVEVDVELGRVYYDENGYMWVSEENVDSERSSAPWLTIEPQNFVMDPERRQNIRISLDVPPDVSGGYYSCVVLNTRLVDDTAATTLPSPIYCPIYLTVPPNLEPGGEIVRIDVEHIEASAMSLEAEFRNTGNIHNMIRGSVKLQLWVEPGSVPGLEIMDVASFKDVAVVQLETDSSYVLPGETRVVSSQIIRGLPAGRYRAEAVINYGGTTPAIMEQEFVIKATD
jgi:P pilus assembly chaperone PapD